MDFLKGIAKDINSEYTQLAQDIDETEKFVDTGSYIFNGLVSGSIFGGISGNKITAIAGESSTGKTFFAMAVVKNFLVQNPTGGVVYFDTESAITRSLLSDRGVDTSRVLVTNVVTIEEFRTQALKIVDNYQKQPKEDRAPLMFVLDSLGMLSTEKEITDALNDKQVRDMTKSQLVKGAFRMLTLKLGQAEIPMIVTNHTYDVIGAYVPTKEMGGGCLVAGTEVQTENGLTPIEELVVGDKVRTMFGYSPVTDTFHFTDKEVYELELEDGETIRCSGEHKFLVDTGDGYEWRCVTDLLPSDVIKSIGGMDQIVKSIKKVKTEDVYDVTVEGEHHYILGNGVVSHNSGLKYSATSIIYLSKSKEKDGKEIIGNIIKCKMAKSRLTKENKQVGVRLYYDERGLDRYYGLLELGEEGGLWKNVAGRYDMGDGKKIYAKQILANPEEYFTDEVMEKLDVIAQGTFKYGG